MARVSKKSEVKRRRVEFKLDLRTAREVILVGDFNGWDPKRHPMLRGKDGIWRKVVMIPPGRYEYRFCVDGEWLNDPANDTVCANCFGTENNVIEITS
jgi:1,4-alpha-glucan branching enzyme